MEVFAMELGIPFFLGLIIAAIVLKWVRQLLRNL